MSEVAFNLPSGRDKHIATFYSHLLQVLNGFLAKSDGKDKLTALIQVSSLHYSCETNCGRSAQHKLNPLSLESASPIPIFCFPRCCLLGDLGSGVLPRSIAEALSRRLTFLMCARLARSMRACSCRLASPATLRKSKRP